MSEIQVVNDNLKFEPMNFDRISRQNILDALSEIDECGIPASRRSKKYDLISTGKSYPPKYVLSLAHRYATGRELDWKEFSGGEQTNSLLIELGFEIKGGISEVPVKLHANEKVKGASKEKLQIVTAIVKSNEKFDNKSRVSLLEKIIKTTDRQTRVLVLPGGFLVYKSFGEKELITLEKEISSLIIHYNENLIVCIGVDAAKLNKKSEIAKDQFGVAISRDGKIAVGRKFHPTSYEKSRIRYSLTANEKEFGLDRTFEIHRRKFFLAVCYDSFGIRHNKLKKNRVSVVLNHIHKFYPKGEEVSGDAYFARHGLAGAAKQWRCPVFGSAVFINREIPENWPAGVKWTKGRISTQKWKYKDNPIEPLKIESISMKNESAELRYFKI